MYLSFRNWLESFGGLAPPKQDPTKVGKGAFADFQGPEGTNPHRSDATLPPINRKRFLKKMRKMRKK